MCAAEVQESQDGCWPQWPLERGSEAFSQLEALEAVGVALEEVRLRLDHALNEYADWVVAFQQALGSSSTKREN